MRPFLKWPGGKYRLLKDILPHLNETTLIEPFCGAGAVFLNAQKGYKIIADINPHLINVYHIIKTNKDEFISLCCDLFKSEQSEAKYYDIRDSFNQGGSNLEQAYRFVYLNRHGYNGLCRFNSKGEFNVPYGKYKSVYFPLNEIKYAHDILLECDIFLLDFRDIFRLAPEGGVIYCDPPYDGRFSAYSKESFGKQDQIDLANCVKNFPGKVVVSNSDTNLIRGLYDGCQFIELDVQRNISCKDREKDKELLIIKEKVQ